LRLNAVGCKPKRLVQVKIAAHTDQMDWTNPSPTLFRAVFFSLLVPASFAQAEPEPRVFVVRERATASLLGGELTFRVLKIRGYTIDVKAFGKKRMLKIGDTLSAQSADCLVTFQEIAAETRLARFTTDC